MPRYAVTITRPITESTVVEVEADNPEEAESKAFETLWNASDTLWELDEGSWNLGDPSVTAIKPMEENRKP